MHTYPLHRLIIFLFIGIFLTSAVWAAPYFYVNSTPGAERFHYKSLDIYLVTGAQFLTVAQAVLNFNSTYLSPYMISILGSRCSLWTPADPSLGLGTSFQTPAFANGNKVVMSCGFSNPGYQSLDSTGNLIATITLYPTTVGTTTLTFSNTAYIYGPNSIAPGFSIPFDLTIYESSSGAQATPTPSPTPPPTPLAGCNDTCNISSDCSAGLTCILPGACRNTLCTSETNCVCPTVPPSPTASPGPTSAPTPTPNSSITPSDSLSAGDMTFVEIGKSAPNSNAPSDAIVKVVDEDNSIPGAPNFTPRPRSSPLAFALFGGGGTGIGGGGGDVLAVQSLRELLIPGKSKADKTVVMINLISTLTFLILLSIIIWRLITVSRTNKLKTLHLQELLASELSTLESKLNAVDSPERTAQIKQDIDTTLDKLTGSVTDKK
jgi:hypothetical protein